MDREIDDYNNSEVVIKRIPLPGNAGIHAGRTGFEKEMAWRKERNKDLAPDCMFPILKWDDLEIVFDGRQYDA